MPNKCFDDYKVSPGDLPNEGYMFVDHSEKSRNGHLGHALVECADGELIAYYPNCDDTYLDGHCGNGWMEYKRSKDGGETWSDPEILDYSYNMYASHCGRSVMCEKIVCTDTGALVAFYLVCDMDENGQLWEPYWIPTYSRSTDNGHTWSRVEPISTQRGRIYDALYHDGKIYVLFFANDARKHFVGVLPEHHYEILVSEDDGFTFKPVSNVGIDVMNRGYGTMEFLENGDLITYFYDINDEQNLDYCISHDNAVTWDAPGKTFFEKKLRNPQMIRFGGGYFIHGRSGSFGDMSHHFVIYYSEDGIHWDEGRYMAFRGPGLGAYSNNLVVGAHTPGAKKRLLIQTSQAYRGSRTNVIYWWIDT